MVLENICPPLKRACLRLRRCRFGRLKTKAVFHAWTLVPRANGLVSCAVSYISRFGSCQIEMSRPSFDNACRVHTNLVETIRTGAPLCVAVLQAACGGDLGRPHGH